MKKALLALAIIFLSGFIFSRARTYYEISDGSVKQLYHLENTSDSAGNYTLTVENGAATTSAKFNFGYDFPQSASNNNTERLKYNQNGGSYDFGAVHTIHMWYRPSALSNGANAPFFLNFASNNCRLFNWIDSAPNKITFYNNISTDLVSATSLATSTWYMIDETQDGSVGKLYVNGVLEASSTNETGSCANSIQNDVFFIGRSAGTNGSAQGTIDEVALLTKALTQSAITSLWNNGAGQEICATAGCGGALTDGSAYFDGNSAWRWPATNLGLNSTQAFTIEFWYKTTSTSTMQFLDTRKNSTSSGFAVSRDANGINFSLNCGGVTSSTVHLAGAGYQSNRLSSDAGGNWHHVAITKKADTSSSTDAFKLYFDTVQQAGDNCYASTSTDSIWIGGNPSSTANLFTGYIDEVRIWKTERSSSDIATYYKQEVTSTDSNLLGYWRFNGTSTDIRWGNATSGQTGSPILSASTPFGHFVEASSSFSVTSSQVRWYGSTKYSDQWLSSISTWNNEGPIVITSTTASTTALIVSDVASSGAAWVGRYISPNPSLGGAGATTSSIELNTYFLDTYSSSSIQNAATHELGHALGLDHSWYGNVMNYYSTSQTSTGPQDKKDYHYLWGY